MSTLPDFSEYKSKKSADTCTISDFSDLYSTLNIKTIDQVLDNNGGMQTLVDQGPGCDGVCFHQEKEYLMNNASMLPISGDFVYYDHQLSRFCDILMNFQFEGVDHVEFVSNDYRHLSVTDLKSLIYIAALTSYCDVRLRLYFRRDAIPQQFKMTYDSVLLCVETRKDVMIKPLKTEIHTYYGGVIKEIGSDF